MSHSLAQQALETMGMITSPYIRLNRSTDLTLTTTWQRVDYNGTSTRNTNTFPNAPGTSNPLVEWDSTSKVFKFNTTVDKHYDLLMNYRINSSTLISLLNLTMTTVQLRFIVPSPTPRYFPLPDDGGYIDIAYTGLATDVRNTMNYILRAVPDVMQYGIGVEMRIAGTALGVIKLMTSDMSLYGR